ncbi:hypothetical protein C8R43DRAFT_1237155 [Mycena crocata]|nr:hypothetical protein C8R43DRAFT_1237155 [Mycena crocata]
MSAFADVPSEVLLLVITYLEVHQVLRLRQTSRTICQLTRDKTVWLGFLERVRRRGDIPLPPAVCDPAIPVTELSSSSIESVVVSATRAADAWQRPKKLTPILNPLHGEPLNGLNIFLETWLLIVYRDGLVYLWNLTADAPEEASRNSVEFVLGFFGSRGWTDNLGHDENFETVLYEVKIGITDSTGKIFNLVRSFDCPIPRTIHAIDVDNKFLVLSSSTRTLDILHWDTEWGRTSRIALDDDAEELYNGVIALRLLGSYLLVIRTHTIELHPYGNAPQPVRPLLHRVPFPLREGAVSLSDPVDFPAPLDFQGRRMRLNLLAYDAHSLAFYTILIATSAHPTLDVTLTGEMRPSPPKMHVGTPLARSHWFVSTLALGRQGIRLLWIERDSLTMTRHVRLCAFNRHSTWHEMKTAARVFTLTSYDLREDLTHCALAEVSGRIVLGNRAGHVFSLKATPALQSAN